MTVDERVKDYLLRAKEIMGIEIDGDFKTEENLWKMTEMILRCASMIQVEELCERYSQPIKKTTKGGSR